VTIGEDDVSLLWVYQMPTYSLRQHDNSVWYIHWTDGRRSKRESTGQTEKAKAQIYLGEWLKGEKADREAKTPEFTVADLWNLYFQKHVEKNNVTTEPAESVWKNLGAHFGLLLLPQVAAAVDAYINLRRSGKIGRVPAKLSTIRNELIALRAALAWCAKPKQKIIPPGEIPAFDLPPAGEPRDRWLRIEEVKKLLAAAAKHRTGERLSQVERFLWLALETSTRVTAALELTWDRVDFELGVIHFNVPGRRKTKKRRVSCPISKALRPILERAATERNSNYVLDAPNRYMWRDVKRIAKLAGVERVSPHVLRHTAGTLMLRGGVPAWQVAGVLGVTLQTLLNNYAHHVPDGLIGAVDMISGGQLEQV
jgi:integrase